MYLHTYLTNDFSQMNALKWLKEEIKEEWSDIASKQMKRFMIIMGLCVLLAVISAIFHVWLLFVIILFLIYWESREAIWNLHGIEWLVSAIILLATGGVILGLLNII